MARVAWGDGPSGLRFASLIVLVLAAGAALVVFGESARASHTAGGVYVGSHSSGGRFELRVDASGGQVEEYRAFPLRLPQGCPEALVVPGRGFIPIVNHSFRAVLISSAGYTVTVTGSFPATGTAQGTLVFSCGGASPSLTWSATIGGSTTPPAPPSPAAGSRPFFRGGHDSVKLVRGGRGRRIVSVRAKFRACAGTPPFRLAVTQRRRVGSAILAEASFRRPLTGGRPASEQGCRDYTVTWRLAPKFFGAGHVVIGLQIVDATGAQSPTPRWAVRAPKR